MLSHLLVHHQRTLSQAPRLPSLLYARHGQIPTALPRSISTSLPRVKKYTWVRGIGYWVLAGGSIYVLDKQFNASAIVRNVRTLYTGAIMAADYKLNFKPGQGEKILALHERVAERLYNLMIDNGGLYIKIGQAIAANTALLPAPFQTRFSKLFDEAPQVSYSDIERVFMSEFGKPPAGEGGIFEEFEEQAVASASVAQVHRARLKKRPGIDGNPGDSTEEWVAVKVQKPAVSKQVEWDLAAYKALMWMYEKWVFDLPIYFLVDFICFHLRLELDFLNEARNAQETAMLVASEPKLAGKVYVPKVYNEYTTAKVMTAEYIDGVKLSDRRAIRRLLDGAPSASSLSPGPDPAANPNWDGSGSAHQNSYSNLPIRGGARSIMETLVSLFSVQIFQWGFVHCDPHPGNVIIRRLVPSNEAQLVLIDHGLYVRLPEDLRRSYARLWKGLLSGDLKEVGDVASEWGIGGGSEELLASGVLLKPWRARDRRHGNGGEKKEIDQYERSLIMKERLRQFLTDTERFPQALVFLGRNMRIVQGNNQALGSPVNRVKIIGHWASRSLATAPNLALSQRLIEYWHHATYLTVIFALDVAFWISKVRQWARGGLGGSFEDEIEREMRRFSKENLGVELSEDAFNA